MAHRKVSGLLVVTSSRLGDERLQRLQKTGLAIVALDRPLSGIQTDAVIVENRIGAEEAVHRPMEHGHRRIACVGYDEDVYPVRQRIEGYVSRMDAARLKPMLTLGVDTLEGMRVWLREAMKAKERPTAIFSLNHRATVFLPQVLSEAGVAIPKEMALIGFDDFDLASILSPPLTTVAQSPVEVANRAMALPIDRIAHHSNGTEFAPVKIVLPVTLTIRASCGCVPGASH